MFPQIRSAGWPRQLGAGLILLALWLQVLAPAAGVSAHARQAEAAAADALIHAIICGRDPSTGIATDLPAQRSDCDRCPFCRCTAAAPLPVVPEAVVGHFVWHRITWPMPPPAHGPRPSRTARQARAPPETV